MDCSGPRRSPAGVPPGSLWPPAELTWLIQPVASTLAVGGIRTGRVGAPNARPWHLHRSEPGQGHPNAMHKRCTRGAHRMHTLAKLVRLLCVSCAPLVHGPKSRRGVFRLQPFRPPSRPIFRRPPFSSRHSVYVWLLASGLESSPSPTQTSCFELARRGSSPDLIPPCALKEASSRGPSNGR